MLNIFIYISTDNTLYVKYMFMYLVSLHKSLCHNTTEYLYSHYVIQMEDRW